LSDDNNKSDSLNNSSNISQIVKVGLFSLVCCLKLLDYQEFLEYLDEKQDEV